MLWLVPLLPILAAVLLAPWWRHASRRAMAVSSAGVVAITLVLTWLAEAGGWTGMLQWSGVLALELGLTDQTRLPALIVPLVAAPIILYAAAHETAERLGRLVSLLVAFVGVMELLILARDLLTLLIAWEVAGALSWVLIGHEYEDNRTGRHAAQAFITTRAADLGLYLAAFVAFQQTGGFEYAGLTALESPYAELFAAGVIVAALGKSAQLPFAPWLFSAMSGPVPVSALLHASTMVAAGVILLAQMQPLLAEVIWFGPVVLGAGLATAIAGGLVAIASPHAKRLLAGSTSAHYGLMFVAIGAGYPAIGLLHFALHAVMKAPLFLTGGIAGQQAGSHEFRHLGHEPLPRWLRWASLAAALGLAGLVPLGPAWSKEMVMTATGTISPWIAVLVALAGGISAIYAAQFQWALFPENLGSETESEASVARWGRGAVYFLAGLVLISSVAWIPDVGKAVADRLAASFPETKLWEFLLSLALVLLGLYSGKKLAWSQWWSTERPAWIAFFTDWMKLRQLASFAVVWPVHNVAKALAALDDRVVDAGIRLCADFALWLADFGSRAGEWVFDGLPEGLARLTGRAGQGASQSQTGQLHHYYSLLVAGLFVMALPLIIAAYTGGFS
ncbi:MAG: NADH-quinone oxidoreductase subunit 5 family protein [Candidatus Wenzhouxiangella sp. M2_3B_020]